MIKGDPKGKIIVVGVDGMDPRLTKKFLDEGKMPNVKKLLEHGSAREDLVMLGALPTITAAMDNIGNRSLSWHSWNYLFLESASYQIGYIGIFFGFS